MSGYTYFNKLKEDNIYLSEPNEDVMKYLDTTDRNDLSKRIIANRQTDVQSVKDDDTHMLSHVISEEYIQGLPGIDKASDVILQHINDNDNILLLADGDVDGITSGTIGKLMFKQLLDIDIEVIVNNKRVDGYGINNNLVDRVIDYHSRKPYDLIMTSDHGANDGVNIKRLTDTISVDVVVTDHHLYDDNTMPKTAVAFVNSQAPDSTVSRNITGTHVLFYVLLDVLYKKHNNNIPNSKLNLVYYLLTYVGMTTISDCMDLKDYVNRKIIKKAMGIINNKKIKHNPFWTTVRAKLDKSYYINETTLGFELIPMLNSTGRIDTPTKSYEFMTVEDEYYGEFLYNSINNINVVRKELQTKAINSKNIIEYTSDTVYVGMGKDMKDVQGIIASRMLNDHNYMLSIIFYPTKNGMLAGSGRMVTNGNDANLRDIISNVSDKCDLVNRFGGHSGAVGLEIQDDLESFFNLLKDEVDNNTSLKRDDNIYVDEAIYSNKKLITSMYDVRNNGPYGIGYKRPAFVSEVTIESYRVYDKKTNVYLSMMVKLSRDSDYKVNVFYSIPMGIKDAFLEELKYSKKCILVYNISVNSYMGNNKVSLDALRIFLK